MMVGLCFFTIAIVAQDQGPRSMDPTKMAANMTEQIEKNVPGLTEEQKEKIENINLSFAKKMASFHPQMTEGQHPSESDMNEMKASMDKQMSDYKAEIKTVLDDKQYKKFEAYQNEQQNQRQEGPGEPEEPEESD